MMFSPYCRSRLKRVLPLAFCFSLLVASFAPSTGFALPIVSSTGLIELNSLTFFIPDPFKIDWIFIADETPSNLSSAQVALNNPVDPKEAVQEVLGAFANTSAEVTLSDESGMVTGNAATSVSTDFVFSTSAYSNIALTSGPSLAEVSIAQGTIIGQFTVSGYTELTLNPLLTANAFYTYSQSVNSIEGGSASSDILAEIYLFNADTGEQLAFSNFSSVISNNGPNPFPPANGGGNLNFSWQLSPNVTYEFLSSASTVASANAPVPEPVSMLLFGTGVVVFGGYLRRSSKKGK